MIVARIEVCSLLHGHIRRAVLPAIPVETIRRCLDLRQKLPCLLDIVGAPSRIAGFGDPDFGCGFVAVQYDPHLGPVPTPVSPFPELTAPGAREAVDAARPPLCHADIGSASC